MLNSQPPVKVPHSTTRDGLMMRIRPLGKIPMRSASDVATNVQSPPVRRDWTMEVDGGERRPLRRQMLFLYGTGLAIGLHLALIHLFLFRSVGAFFFFLVATVFFSTATLGLWQWVLPRFSELRPLARFSAQVLISVVAFAVLSFMATEVNAFLLGGHSFVMDHPKALIERYYQWGLAIREVYKELNRSRILVGYCFA